MPNREKTPEPGHQQNLNFGIDDGSFHREPIESALPHSYAQISETVQSYLEP